MAKEESGRLLSKVAKFVRNPLKDWSDIDAQGADGDVAGGETGYSREALKEMIERRQRNDFVRRREFDMLRKLRQREAAGTRDPSATPSSFNVSSTNGKTEGRALTLKKIDEIEEQMSQQWWKGRNGDGSGRDGSTTGSADMAAQHSRAYADTTPGESPGQPDSAPPSTAGGLSPSRLVYDSALEESAIRFSQGDDAGAEAVLLQAVAPDGPHAEHDDCWLALLDLYRATGDAEKFVSANMRYAQRLKRQGPQWVSFRALARDRQAATAARGGSAASRPGADWFSPPQLGRDGLGELTRSLAAVPGPVWTLDWRALQGVEEDAVAPLRSLFSHWAKSPVQLRFAGGARLAAVLEAKTPSNERGVDTGWWQLRMEALRVMHAADDFELAALNYCITYEVSPPPWTDPRGTYTALGALPAGNALPTFTLSGLGGEDDGEAARQPAMPELVGELAGASPQLWKQLDAELADADALVISCAALVRMDMAAAGALLAWVTARDARGQRVHFVETHRLLVAFFGVVGIADHAAIGTRLH